jgi:hypothetical protein
MFLFIVDILFTYTNSFSFGFAFALGMAFWRRTGETRAIGALDRRLFFLPFFSFFLAGIFLVRLSGGERAELFGYQRQGKNRACRIVHFRVPLYGIAR